MRPRRPRLAGPQQQRSLTSLAAPHLADVANILLQLLDEGKLTDSQGRAVDFKNSESLHTSSPAPPSKRS